MAEEKRRQVDLGTIKVNLKFEQALQPISPKQKAFTKKELTLIAKDIIKSINKYQMKLNKGKMASFTNEEKRTTKRRQP